MAIINYKDIVSNNFIFSNDSFKWIEFDKKINKLKKKYPNLISDFKAFEGFAFSSKFYIKDYNKDINNKTRLIQIGNINEKEWVLTSKQNFEFLPNKYIITKSKYLLKQKHILISLTGGSDLSKDISTYFDNTFNAFLNQRTIAFSTNGKDIDNFFYFYAFTKSLFFKEQWIGKGGIQKNTGSSERKKIFIPKIDNKKVIKYISLLTQSIINKEKEIIKKHNAILEKIEKELLENQKDNKFSFNYPTFTEIENVGRIDTNLYRKKFKQIDFKIKNYINGYQTIYELGFSLSRGQNLQISNIGKSIYSKKFHKGFYTLMLPKHLSKYGIVNTKEYLGNTRNLRTLKKGDLIFGAEGFEKGRSIVIIEQKAKTITNIHGITIQQEEENITKAIFVKCFLDYLRYNEIIDLFAVGGNGGSLAQKYWSHISFPKFKEIKQKELAKLYHNSEINFDKVNLANIDNFIELDNEFNADAGIYELDKSAKKYKERLDEVINKIANDEEINIDFNLIEIKQ